MIDTFNKFYNGKRILVTGHTGFKGSWLSIWLHELGAQVVGVSLDPDFPQCVYCLSDLGHKIYADIRADIREFDTINKIFNEFQPEIIFHLAAQPLVRKSYSAPIETYQTNVMGSINIMEAIRNTPSVRVGVMITTDKVYENKEQTQGYVETDPFGGYDPYSSSKGACEIAISSWRRSFFNPLDYGKTHHVSLSSARAGNVIGGGDWAQDRIIPDCIRAIQAGSPIVLRSPESIRPWEHVLEPLSGYLLLAKRQWESPQEFCDGWNFGPEESSVKTVGELARKIAQHFNFKKIELNPQNANLHEAKLLMLNINKAKEKLGWEPRLSFDETTNLVADWYKHYADTDVYTLCVNQISTFLNSHKHHRTPL